MSSHEVVKTSIVSAYPRSRNFLDASTFEALMEESHCCRGWSRVAHSEVDSCEVDGIGGAKVQLARSLGERRQVTR